MVACKSVGEYNRNNEERKKCLEERRTQQMKDREQKPTAEPITARTQINRGNTETQREIHAGITKK